MGRNAKGASAVCTHAVLGSIPSRSTQVNGFAKISPERRKDLAYTALA